MKHGKLICVAIRKKAAQISFICVIENFVSITQIRSAGMRTAAYNVDVASDRRRRKNVPRHILYLYPKYSLPICIYNAGFQIKIMIE